MKKLSFITLLATFVSAPLVLFGEDHQSVLTEMGLSSDWKLSLTVFVDYGDNRDKVPDHYVEPADERYRYEKEDDIKYGIRPRISYTGHLSDSQTCRLAYSPIYHYWQNPRVGHKRSEFSHLANAEYSFNADDQNSFTIGDDFRYILNDRWYLDADAVERSTAIDKKHVEHEQEHYDNTARVKWDHQISSRTAIGLSAYWNAIRYDDDVMADTNDEDKYGARLTYNRASSGQFKYGLFLHFRGWNEEDTVWTSRDGRYATERVERGIDTYTAGITSSYRWDERLTLHGSYGWEFIDYESDSIDDRNFPGDLDLSATYALALRTRGTLGFRYYVSEAWVYPYASQDLFSFYGSIQHTLSQSVILHARAEYKISEYDLKYVPDQAKNETFLYKHEGDKKQLYLEVGANYRVTDAFSLSVAYGYEDVDSDVSASYNENSIRASATYLF